MKKQNKNKTKFQAVESLIIHRFPSRHVPYEHLFSLHVPLKIPAIRKRPEYHDLSLLLVFLSHTLYQASPPGLPVLPNVYCFTRMPTNGKAIARKVL